MDPGDTRKTFSVLMTVQADNEHDVLVLRPPTSIEVPTGTTIRRATRTSCVEVMRTEVLAPGFENHHKLKLGCRNNANLRKGTKVATVFALNIIVECILLAFCICRRESNRLPRHHNRSGESARQIRSSGKLFQCCNTEARTPFTLRLAPLRALIESAGSTVAPWQYARASP